MAQTQGFRYFLEQPHGKIELPEGEVTIGRSRDCTVALKDVTVSRHHALLYLAQGQVRVRDLESSNGTYVNGRRVQGEAEAADGDRVTVGESELLLRILAPREAPLGTVRIELGELFCPHCGAPLGRDAVVCPACGRSPVMGEDTVWPAAPPLEPAPAANPPPAPPPPAVAPPAPALVAGPPPAADRPAPQPPIGGAPFVSADRPGGPSSQPPATAPWREGPTTQPPRRGLASTSGELLPSIRELEEVPSASAPAAVPLAAPGPLPIWRPAGFWIRLAAALLDGLWIWIVALVPILLLRPAEPMALVGLLSSVLGVAVPILGWGLWGTTPGKRLLGLRVRVGEESRGGIGVGRALLRWLGYLASALPLGAGFLMIAFSARKRGLHDLMAGTSVVRH